MPDQELPTEKKPKTVKRTRKRSTSKTTKKAQSKKSVSTSPKSKKNTYQDPFSAKPLFRILILLVVLFGVVLLLGGLSSLKDPDPQRHVNKMLSFYMTKNAVSFVKFDINAQFEVNFPHFEEFGNESFLNVMTIKGMSDYTNADTKREYTQIDYEAKALNLLANVEMVKVGDKGFLKLNTAQIPFIFSDLDEVLYQNQWIHWDKQSILRQFGLSDSSDVDKMALQKDTGKSTVKVKLPKGVNVLEVKNVLGKEQFNDIEVIKYKVTFHKDEVMKLLPQYFTSFGISANEMRVLLAQENEIGRFIDAINVSGVEVWIGKDKPFLYRLIISLPNRESAYNGIHSLIMDIKYYDYNVPVSIDAPQISVSLDQFIESLFNQYEQIQSKSVIRERLEAYQQYMQFVQGDFVLTCQDHVFLAQDGEIQSLNLTPDIDPQSEYALTVYMTEYPQTLMMEDIAKCQQDGAYIPIASILAPNTLLWVDESFRSDQGPCEGLISQGEIITPQMQSCFNAVHELQIFMVEALDN